MCWRCWPARQSFAAENRWAHSTGIFWGTEINKQQHGFTAFRAGKNVRRLRAMRSLTRLERFAAAASNMCMLCLPPSFFNRIKSFRFHAAARRVRPVYVYHGRAYCVAGANSANRKVFAKLFQSHKKLQILRRCPARSPSVCLPRTSGLRSRSEQREQESFCQAFSIV